VLLSYKMALLATTLLMSMLLAAFVVLDRRRFVQMPYLPDSPGSPR
jgi:hypothetical protein